MSSEQLATASKPRISPLDLRNTDLVSRLLAATPPYLYNMSLLPNTYFFSEMLRSLVHAKADSARNALHHRRSRKRPWTPSTSDIYQKSSTKTESSPPDWLLKSSASEHKPSELPLELTTNKVCNIGEHRNDHTSPPEKVESFGSSENKPDLNLHNHMNMFSGMHQPESSPNNVILPPPPPPPAAGPPMSNMWYPPLYPGPYGIDPLHFFIDLRVSGHIYDRKAQKDGESTSTSLETAAGAKERERETERDLSRDFFKSSKHTSAFSVPVPAAQRKPMNLSNDPPKQIKFDVKSMGFEDSSSNKRSTNYILNNIGEIYKTVNESKENVKKELENGDSDELSEEEKKKRDKDLRALIGLELVVDYMSQDKPKTTLSDSSTTDTDSGSRSSPALEVVAIQDDNDRHSVPDSCYT